MKHFKGNLFYLLQSSQTGGNWFESVVDVVVVVVVVVVVGALDVVDLQMHSVPRLHSPQAVVSTFQVKCLSDQTHITKQPGGWLSWLCHFCICVFPHLQTSGPPHFLHAASRSISRAACLHSSGVVI